MTFEQESLKHQIAHQRKVCAVFPHDLVEAVALDTLITKLRETFVLVTSDDWAKEEKTPARGTLRRVV